MRTLQIFLFFCIVKGNRGASAAGGGAAQAASSPTAATPRDKARFMDVYLPYSACLPLLTIIAYSCQMAPKKARLSGGQRRERSGCAAFPLNVQRIAELQGQAVGIEMGDIGHTQADGRGHAVWMVLKMQDRHRRMVQVKAGPEQHRGRSFPRKWRRRCRQS